MGVHAVNLHRLALFVKVLRPGMLYIRFLFLNSVRPSLNSRTSTANAPPAGLWPRREGGAATSAGAGTAEVNDGRCTACDHCE